MSQEVENIQCTPPVLAEIANSAIGTLIPEKSRKIYEFAYDRFVNWATEQNAHTYSENVMLAYFSHLAHKMKSSTLWAQYSMIKSELNIKHNINISKYTKLIAYLKRQGDGYKPKKSKVLTKEQFDDFLHNAPNNVYLATKVIMIFGITGACRCDELLQMTVKDIEDLDKLIIVKIPNSKTKKSRSFTIVGDYYINLYREYAALRPKDISTSRFFIKYQNGRCHRVVIGIHKISNVPKEVAAYLKLPNPTEYTGHCLRRTSATLLVDNGGDISSLKRLGGWNSSSVAEGYIEESMTNKTQTAMKILGVKSTEITRNTPASDIFENINTFQNNEVPTDTITLENTNQISSTRTASSGLNIQSCKLENCSFNITVVNK